MREHLTKKMSGDKPRFVSTIGDIIVAERREKGLQFWASDEGREIMASMRQKHLNEKVRYIEAVLSRGNYKKPENALKYLDCFKHYPVTRKYLDQVIDQFREARFSPRVGHILGLLLKLKKSAAEGKFIDGTPLPDADPERWEFRKTRRFKEKKF